MKTPDYIKLDASGNCIHICRDGITEHWTQLVQEGGLSQRKAAEHIYEILQSYVVTETPIEVPSAEKIREQARYDSEKPGENSPKVEEPEITETSHIGSQPLDLPTYTPCSVCAEKDLEIADLKAQLKLAKEERDRAILQAVEAEEKPKRSHPSFVANINELVKENF